MFRILMEERWISGGMIGLFVMSLFLRVLLGVSYQNMIREADNMSATGNKFLKQCKTKFANCYQLNQGVSNIPVFVDKFLSRLAIGPLSFETIDHLSGQVMLLSVVCAGVGICRSIVGGKMLGQILPFYILCFLELYLYFSVSAVLDIRGKRRILKIQLVDYLENHLSARIHVTKKDMDMLYGEKEEPVRRTSRPSSKKTAEGEGVTQEELEALLEEVLGIFS